MPTVLYALIKGFVFGVTMAAIPGPIFFLIIQRTLADGALTGLFCGLGAVTADTAYALLAVIGLSFIAQLLLSYQSWLTLAGGLFLIYLGIKTYRRKLFAKTVEIQDRRLIAAWFSTFLLTLANPVTILSYSIIFAGLGLSEPGANFKTTLSLVGGVIIGATMVVVVMVSFLSYYRQKLSSSTLNIINKMGSIILFGFGIATLVRSIKCLGL